jgi:hypothetical protein
MDGAQFELAGVGFAVEGMPSGVREIIVIIDGSLGFELADKKLFLSRFSSDPLTWPSGLPDGLCCLWLRGLSGSLEASHMSTKVERCLSWFRGF